MGHFCAYGTLSTTSSIYMEETAQTSSPPIISISLTSLIILKYTIAFREKCLWNIRISSFVFSQRLVTPSVGSTRNQQTLQNGSLESVLIERMHSIQEGIYCRVGEKEFLAREVYPSIKLYRTVESLNAGCPRIYSLYQSSITSPSLVFLRS